MSATRTFRLAWLYPDLLELYGDTGNITILRRRCAAAGVTLEVDQFTVGESVNLVEYDFVFLGGGSDREQQIFYADLMGRADNFREAIESDVVIVTICGGYQLFGQYYRSVSGTQIDGMGIFDFYTIGSPPRTIGYLVEEAVIDGVRMTLTGFENHSGLTYQVDTPLAKVIRGTGNNKDDDGEGIQYRNLIGTYMHGPLLARNPALLDALLQKMARRNGLELNLPPRSRFAQAAQDQVLHEFGLPPAAD